jgi:hypothetical protein
MQTDESGTRRHSQRGNLLKLQPERQATRDQSWMSEASRTGQSFWLMFRFIFVTVAPSKDKRSAPCVALDFIDALLLSLTYHPGGPKKIMLSTALQPDQGMGDHLGWLRRLAPGGR